MRKLLTNKFTIIAVILIAIALPITVWQVQRSQDIRQRANTPQGVITVIDPITSSYSIGEKIPVSVLITTTHDVGSVEMTINYNPQLLSLTNVSPEAPLLLLSENSTSNSKTVTLYNPSETKVLGQNIKIVTFNFTALNSGTANVSLSPTLKYTATGVNGFITFDPLSTLLATYIISSNQSGSATPTSSVAEDVTPIPTENMPMTTTSPTQSPTSIPQVGNTTYNLTLILSGVGTSATASQQLNSNPVRKTREGDLLVYDGNLNLIDAYKFNAVYNGASSTYIASANLGNLPSGNYLIKARLDNTLFKFIPGIQTIIGGTSNAYATPLRLLSGDIVRTTSSDNTIDIHDYSVLLSCLSAIVSNISANFTGTPTCGIQQAVKADLNDDDVIDLKDLNILLRAFASRVGD